MKETVNYISEKLKERDLDFLTDHLYIGLRAKSDVIGIKEESIFEDIEKYLYLRCEDEEGIVSTMVTKYILDSFNISEQAAWNCAMINVKKETSISEITDVINELSGITVPEVGLKMYVVTNTSQTKGASAILDSEALYSLAQDLKTRYLMCMPSSIHEWIVVSSNDTEDLKELSKIVHEVNTEVLDEEDFLSDRAYIYDSVEEVAA